MSTMMITPPDWFDRALKPRQRRIFVLRWNPAISSYTTERFLEHFSQYKAGEGLDMKILLGSNEAQIFYVDEA